tara:strand:- start:1389 stop:3665 length:2277 start_codon:yes stop_codon:yes gene_type:complete
MTSKKNYLLISLSLFSVFSFTQTIDPSLLSQLSPDQIEAAQDVLETKNLSELENQDSPEIQESLAKVEVEKDEKIDKTNPKKYGYDFFSTMPTSLSAVGDLPLPNDYKISLKDQFKVILSGSRDQIFNLNVNLDGTILFPELGSVYVAGLTFEEVKEKLSNMINQSYIGVSIDISLQNLSAKKVTIVGAVNTPGTYLVNPFSTITGALGYSGGISEIGSLRDIKLIRNDGTIFSYDLYDLLIKGDRTNDLTIQAGDTILIDAASQFVEIKGEVNRPSIYEILEGEEISDIVDFALGFTQTANKSNISISYLDLEKSVVESKTNASMDQSLKNVLVVDVFNYVSEDNLSISVKGAVEEPGFYDLKKYKNLSDLIEDLNFVGVYPWLAVLEQFDSVNLVKSIVLFNLNDKSTYNSVKLLPNSRLYFANIDEIFFDVDEMASSLIEDYSLTLNYKESSYILPVFGKFSISSFTNLLGLDMSDVENKATYISPLDNKIVVDNYKNMTFTAKKYHNISFRSQVNDLITVTISGAINYPGTYTLQSDSSLSDLYQLVGDFKNEAFLDGIVLTRETVRERQLKAIETSEAALNKSLALTSLQEDDIGDISILSSIAESIEPVNLGRVAGDFSPLSASAANTALFDGDAIIVPKVTNVVNVIGEVLNPIAFEYSESININAAIVKAGGYQSYADKKRVYVIKANGMVEKTARNIFVGNSNLEPGDTIVVPRKLEVTNTILRNLTPITQILSDLAFSAAAIDNLSNN